MKLGVHLYRPLRLSWSDHDEHRPLTVAATVGLTLGAVTAAAGLPPVDLHGPLHYLGIMDPLCGMTRGVQAVLRGHLGRAVAYNPASPVVLLGAIGAAGRAVVGRAGGHWLTIHVHAGRGLVGTGVVAISALWVNQQLHARLLMG